MLLRWPAVAEGSAEAQPKQAHGLEIETRWIAQDVGDMAPPNYEIARAPLTTKAPLNLAQLSRPTNGWPLGLYRLELWHAGTAFHTVYFAIEDVEAERE